MNYGFAIAVMAALASAPVLAQEPIPLHSGSVAYQAATPWSPPSSEPAQTQVPAYPTARAPAVPPSPAPAARPSYIWEAGHWVWNGFQYVWQPGRYVEGPMAPVSPVLGHWEQQSPGWEEGAGSSTPPPGYPAFR